MFDFWFVPFIVILPFIVWVVVIITLLIRNALNRNWRRVASIIVAPIIAVFFWWGLGKLGVTPDLVYLEIKKPAYMREISRFKVDGDNRLLSWDWGSTGFAVTADCDYTLFYDESDQIILLPSARSADWNKRLDKNQRLLLKAYPKWYADQHPAPHGNITVEHLEGHFYLVKYWTW
ncbi:hypothetical protein [Lucifera butyrica]|nr:hypothetical protein [Lucifera butyrica]